MTEVVRTKPHHLPASAFYAPLGMQELPEGMYWRWAHMPHILRWLRANGVNPVDVPLESPVVYDRSHLIYHVYVRDTAGHLVPVKPHAATLLKRTLRTKLRYRWEDAFPLPISGSIYRARARRRTRRRNRR